jgi:hypothetical protein
MAAMYAERSEGFVGWSGTINSAGGSIVERSTIHFASWFGSRGRFPFPTVILVAGLSIPSYTAAVYEVGIHQTPRHHNTGGRDSGFDRFDNTCLPDYLRPLTRTVTPSLPGNLEHKRNEECYP